jgi:hypothetical protein
MAVCFLKIMDFLFERSSIVSNTMSEASVYYFRPATIDKTMFPSLGALEVGRGALSYQ